MFLLQLQLTVQLGDGVENLGKVGALEDPKHDGTEGVAHDGAQVGVHGHLEQTLTTWSVRPISTHPAQEPRTVRHIVASENSTCWPGINQVDSEPRDDSNSCIIIIIIIIIITIMLTYPGEKYDEGVEIEVALAVALRVIVRPDDRQHAQTFGEENHRASRLVSPVLVIVVKLLLQQYPGVLLSQTLSIN